LTDLHLVKCGNKEEAEMRLEKSPGFEQYKDGIPDPPPDPADNRRRFRMVLLAALLLVLLLSIGNFLGSQTAALLTGTGSVTGTVIDEQGQAFRGEIFILGTELAVSTDPNGHFAMDRVPAGAQSLIVADDLFGREFPIQVVAGETIDVGQLQFVPTATP
jgi:hypothetical protein